MFADLDSENYDVRNRATLDLSKFGMWMQGRLKEAAKRPASEEVRQRVEHLYEKLNNPNALPLARERIRVHRVMMILEQSSSPAAVEVLQKLAKGAPERHLQEEAQLSLERIARRK